MLKWSKEHVTQELTPAHDELSWSLSLVWVTYETPSRHQHQAV